MKRMERVYQQPMLGRRNKILVVMVNKMIAAGTNLCRTEKRKKVVKNAVMKSTVKNVVSKR